METNIIIEGDCLLKLKEFPDESIDAIVTDPPYGLSFMGKKWDDFKKQYDPTCNSSSFKKGTGTHPQGYVALDKQAYYNFCYQWAKECLRVLKPGGHLLAFGGTRTYHRMACAIEDAGFEIRDMIEWVYGSGFPKSLNIGKAVDKLQGNEREVVATKKQSGAKFKTAQEQMDNGGFNDPNRTNFSIDKGTSEWEGWGTALKPAHEPICMARKPLAEKTVAENCLKYGTGGINIEESRVPTTDSLNGGEFSEKSDKRNATSFSIPQGNGEYQQPVGRFPANLIVDGCEEVENLFPETKQSKKMIINNKGSFFGGGNNKVEVRGHNDTGGSASRFFYHAEFTEDDYPPIFYCAKASRSERNKGCEELEEQKVGDGRKKEVDNAFQRGKTLRHNTHPTVKPIALMEYLVKLVSRENAIVLDPFAGSGSTLIACKKVGRQYIGIEREPEYVKIARARLNSY